ncbi:MAG: TlpA disulfide reductase family protein [Pirellulaceae bacterium]
MKLARFLVCAALAGALACSRQVPLAAQDTPTDAKPAESDRYTVPETDDVAALVKHLDRLTQFRPRTQQEALNHRKKAPLATRKVAEKILSLDKDPASKNYRLAKRSLLQSEAQKLTDEGSTEARKALLDEIVTFVRAGDKSAEDASLAIGYAVGLEYAPAREVAAEAYTKLGESFADSQNEDVAKQGKTMLGAARRLNLVGQPFALKGTTLEGKPFDIASLKGKVVLVDVWATWCGPCLAEYPNLKKNYDAYHERGFEVVGLSIDQDRTALEEYVAAEKIPWTTLHEKDSHGQHPATVEYGIFGIPTVILIDKEGKVVSTRARGAELGRLLKDLLGS